MNTSKKSRLAASTLLAGLAGLSFPALAGAALLLTPADAHAQNAQPAPAPAAATDADDDDEAIVVTGTIFRNNTNSVSPLTVLDTENLDARGIDTIQGAIQQLSSSGGPSLTNNFSANGAFAGGASGASLRGLSVNSTLVLFDGLRAAYYPLADDGSRNFVDLNTIPDDIVERIEVLRDGASSTYGADAIAGVINIITRREFEGVQIRAEGGLSSEQDAATNRLSITAGVGSLSENGVNAYVSAFRYHSDTLYNRDRGFPFNTDNLTGLCSPDGSSCGGNNILQGSGAAISTGANYLVRPYTVNPNGSLAAVPGGRWQNLDASCPGGGVVRPLTLAEQGTTNPTSLCTYDQTALYAVIQPEITRWGVSGRASFELPSDIRGYAEANFMETKSGYTGFPATNVGNANTGLAYRRYTSNAFGPTSPANDPSSRQLSLPVYVCPDRIACDVDPLGVLNPNNPFAGAGQVARILGRDMTETTETETRNRSYRVAGGINGTFSNDWDWDVGLTAMHTDLNRHTDGYVYIQHLLDVIADGTYNFADPTQPGAVSWAPDAQTTEDYLTPERNALATSDQVHLQGTLSMPIMQLAGGPLQFAIGGSWRYEAVDAPSGNDDYNGPTQRYFTLNAFGTTGDREIRSAFFEVDAPVLENLDINISGRFDDYSSGQSAFSPKIGARWRPIDMLTLRASYSEGFRIPSFGEANALPTTGYVSSTSATYNDPYLAQYGCTVATFSSCPTYIRLASIGETTVATPDLDSEESRSYTAGFIVQPFEGFSIAIDYFNIEKSGAITPATFGDAIEAYYTGGAPVPGINVIADAPDPSFLAATPRIAFVEAPYLNANTVTAEGWDFQVNYDRDITDSISWSSGLDLSYLAELSTSFPDGHTERYDGTLGNFNLTSGNGTQKWHGQWVNTFGVGMFDISATVNYTSGYDLSAQDQGTDYEDCGFNGGDDNGGNSPTGCSVDPAITYDLNVQAHLNDNVTVYGTVLNVSDEMPPIDVITYGAYNYNATQGGDMILGRYFRAGVKLNF